MSKKLSQHSDHEFRTSRESAASFKKPIAVFRAPFNGLIQFRWFQTGAGGVCASQKIGVGEERFAFVTRSEPFTMEWLPLAQYADYRMFSAEYADIPLWSNHWFNELKPIFDMFKHGPKGAAK